MSDLVQAIQKSLAGMTRQFTRNAFCRNVFILGSPWESDGVAITPSLRFIEYEIKLSTADYRKDFEKRVSRFTRKGASQSAKKHDWLASAEKTHEAIPKPQQFYFVAPLGLIDSVPEHCGLIEYGEELNYWRLQCTKSAPMLKHRTKLSEKQLFNLLIKSSYKPAI